MYYYIFEPPLEAKEYERTTHIKEYLAQIGIAGEMVTPTPSRNVEDLVELAIAKRYSTVVAVGGVELTNRVARALEPHDVVFGIIPIKEHVDIAKLIGVQDWKAAADQLKRRRWVPVRLGLFNNQLCFLTPASITLTPTTRYSLHGPDYSATGRGGVITIYPLRGGSLEESTLHVEIQSSPEKRGFLQNLFGSTSKAPGLSRFSLEEFELDTSEPLPVVVAGTDLCSTPVHCAPQTKAVKLIVAKAATEEE